MNRSIKIGSNISLIFENLITDDSSITDESLLKATLALKFSNKEAEKEKLDQLKGVENQVWLQVGENDRVFSTLQENLEPSQFSLSFNLTNLMLKDLQSGITLFAGVEHPYYNVRTQEIPRTVSDSLAQDLSK
jgi:hypothetical protein|tara:strand:- start:715 stop:1113 length:399 start_codon:yes stop_codon:yes gene_type:complete